MSVLSHEIDTSLKELGTISTNWGSKLTRHFHIEMSIHYLVLLCNTPVHDWVCSSVLSIKVHRKIGRFDKDNQELENVHNTTFPHQYKFTALFFSAHSTSTAPICWRWAALPFADQTFRLRFRAASGQRSFEYRATFLWSKLLPELKLSESVKSFNRQLTRLLLDTAFCWLNIFRVFSSLFLILVL